MSATEVQAAPPAPVPAAPAPAPARRARSRGFASIRWEIVGPLSLYLVFTLVPFYWMVVFAFRKTGSTAPVPWPITFDNFNTVWNGIGFRIFFQNSVIVGVGSLVFGTLVAVTGGYAMARYKFRGKQVFMLSLLGTQFIPGAMMLIPLFVIFKHIHVLNTLWSLVIADTVFHLPLSLILMSGFIRNIPVELEEASWVDGCSRLRGFFAVVLPMLRPALVAVGAFAFIGSWNNFLFALMFINDQSKFTIPVGLSYTLGEYNVDFGALAAGGVVAAVPVVIVFGIIQRYLVKGLSAGAVKG